MCLPAFAGDYELIPDDPNGVRNPSGGYAISKFIPIQSFYKPNDGGYGNDSSTGSQDTASGKSELVGTITCNFRWKPDYPGEPLPKSVIVSNTVTIRAGAVGYNAGLGSVNATYNCDTGAVDDSGTGVNHPIYLPVPGPLQIIGANVGIGVTRTGYKVAAGADPLIVTCTPTATVTTVNGSQGVSVRFGATAAAVKISLDGTIGSQSGQQQVLIGQNVMASLSRGSFENYLWSVSGSTLYSFSYNVSSTGTDESGGGAVPFPPEMWTLRSPFWYWYKGGEGQGDGSGGQEQTVSVNAKARLPKSDGTFELVSVSAERKVLVFRSSVGVDYIKFGQTGSSSSGVASNNVFFDPEERAEGQGLELVGRVGTPTSFCTRQGTGGWAWLQLCKLYWD